MGCCYACEYGEVFGDRTARWALRRFRRLGLRGSARLLAESVAAAGVEGRSILEIGGGVGEIQAHLLNAGASTSTNVELSPGYETAARELLREQGLEGRVHRRLGDFVEIADDLPAADIVILHRVICCYPDWQAMLAAALSHSRHTIGLTLPADRPWTRWGMGLGNRFMAMSRRCFRGFVHPPERVLDEIRRAGFPVTVDHSGPVWRTIVATR